MPLIPPTPSMRDARATEGFAFAGPALQGGGPSPMQRTSVGGGFAFAGPALQGGGPSPMQQTSVGGGPAASQQNSVGGGRPYLCNPAYPALQSLYPAGFQGAQAPPYLMAGPVRTLPSPVLPSPVLPS